MGERLRNLQTPNATPALRNQGSSIFVFGVSRATVTRSPGGRQMVRAIIANRVTGQTIAVWECVENGQIRNTIFSNFQNTPFSSALKQFLLQALRQSPSFAALQENGGRAWWIDQTYSELMETLERLLTTQFQETVSRPQAP